MQQRLAGNAIEQRDPDADSNPLSSERMNGLGSGRGHEEGGEANGGHEEIREERTAAQGTTNKKLLGEEIELAPLGAGGAAAVNRFDEMEEEDIRTFEPVNERVCLQWHSIEISALPTPGKCGKKAIGEKRLILDNISGSALPGEFVSIIGASGAGKTTLLNHLSGRLTATNLEIYGDIMING